MAKITGTAFLGINIRDDEDSARITLDEEPVLRVLEVGLRAFEDVAIDQVLDWERATMTAATTAKRMRPVNLFMRRII